MRERDDGQPRQQHNEREADNGRNERDIEDKYLARVADARDDFAQKRIDDQATRLAAVVGTSPAEIREAWHLWRSKDPQPETHSHMDAMQTRLSDDKNLAFATLLARAGVEPRRDEPAQQAPEPVRGDDNPFALAARGAGFKRDEPRQENWGERPNFAVPSPPLDRKPEQPPAQEPAPLMRAALSPVERQVVQAAALEAIARGAIDAARGRDLERPESRHDYFARKRSELDPAEVRSVERDVEKLRNVPGLGDVRIAEREFEKADTRFQAATTDEDRAKAFTRAAALSIVVEDLRRRADAPAPERPQPVRDEPPARPLPEAREPERKAEDPQQPEVVRAGFVPTAPDLANMPTQRRVLEDDTTREERRADPEREREDDRTEPDPRPRSDVREDGTAPGRRRAMSAPEEREADTAPGRQRATPEPEQQDREQPGTAPGRPRSLGKERETPESREEPPMHRIDREGLLIPVHTSEVDPRHIVEERSITYSRDAVRDAFSLRDRDRQNSEDERLGQAAAHEIFCAQDYRDTFTAEKYTYLLDRIADESKRLREDPENADWRVVARKHEVLSDEALERNKRNLHLPERIALAELAMERLSAHHRLVHRITVDHVDELRAAPPWERDELKKEALALLAIESRPNDRPFEDWHFVSRELARVADENSDSTRVLALINAYNRQAAPSLMAEDARWEPDVARRVREQGDALLFEDAATVDARLNAELTSLRMTMILDPDAATRDAARERAKEVSLLVEELPVRRSLEIETN